MTDYLVSYCDYETGKQVAADGTVSMSLGDILVLMDEILTSSGSFVGVTAADGSMLQFIVNDDGSMYFDVPSPGERGSYVKHTTLKICKDVLRAVDGGVRRDAIDGLVFERW